MSNGCRFYYEDSYRKSPKKECRLVQLNPASEEWREGLCRRCRVPEILERNPCANLALEARVGSRWGLLPRMDILAVCTINLDRVADPVRCRQGCEHYRSLP